MTKGSALDTLKAAVIWVAIAASAFLLWQLRDALLILFAAAIGAVLLRAISDLLVQYGKLPPSLAIVLAILIVAAASIGVLWLFGTHLVGEFSDVANRAESSWKSIEGSLQKGEFPDLGQRIKQDSGPILSNVVKSSLLLSVRALEALVVFIVGALYFAAQPKLYRNGIVRLFKPELRTWASGNLDTLATTLKLWICGQLCLMVIVGLLSLVGTWLIGLPSPIALGLIAAASEAIPYVGPFLGAIPALLVAFTKGIHSVEWTAGLYLLIHVVEGYLCAPLIQRYFVEIPPALTVLGLVIVEVIFGDAGLLVAAPLTVCTLLLVKMFYLRDTLHQKVELPEHFAD